MERGEECKPLGEMGRLWMEILSNWDSVVVIS